MKKILAYRLEITIFLIAFVLQTAVTLIHIGIVGNTIHTFTHFGGDSLEHVSLARTLIERHAFISTEGGAPPNFLETDRMPLYPLIAGAVLWCVHWNYAAGIIILHLFGAAAMVMLFRLMRLLVPERPAFIGTLIATFDLERVFLADQFATENLFYCFFFGGIYFVIRYLQEMRAENFSPKSRNLLLGAALLFAAGTMTRVFVLYIALLSLILLCGYAVYLSLRGERHNILVTFLHHTALATILFLALIAPWSARNYYHFHTWQLSSSRQWNTYYRNLVRLYEDEQGIHGTSHDAINEKIDEQFYRDTGADRRYPLDENYLKDFKFGPYIDSQMKKALAGHHIEYAVLAIKRIVPWALDSSISSTITYIDSDFFPLSPVFAKLHISLYPMVFWSTRLVWALIYVFVAIVIIINRKKFADNWPLWFYLFMLVALTGYGAEWSFTTRHKLPFVMMFYSLIVYCVQLVYSSAMSYCGPAEEK